MTPTLQEVSFGDTAQFNCRGVGSFIRIKWRFNNSLVCDARGCDSDMLSYHQENTSDTRNLTINSTLSVNTSLLQGSGSQDILSIECKVEQMMPPDLMLEGEDRVFITSLRISFSPSPTLMATPSGKCSDTLFFFSLVCNYLVCNYSLMVY